MTSICFIASHKQVLNIQNTTKITCRNAGRRYFKKGSLCTDMRISRRTLSSQRTILPRIKKIGMVGNPTNKTKGSACSIKAMPSWYPTTLNRLVSVSEMGICINNALTYKSLIVLFSVNCVNFVLKSLLCIYIDSLKLHAY